MLMVRMVLIVKTPSAQVKGPDHPRVGSLVGLFGIQCRHLLLPGSGTAVSWGVRKRLLHGFNARCRRKVLISSRHLELDHMLSGRFRFSKPSVGVASWHRSVCNLPNDDADWGLAVKQLGDQPFIGHRARMETAPKGVLRRLKSFSCRVHWISRE